MATDGAGLAVLLRLVMHKKYLPVDLLGWGRGEKPKLQLNFLLQLMQTEWIKTPKLHPVPERVVILLSRPWRRYARKLMLKPWIATKTIYYLDILSFYFKLSENEWVVKKRTTLSASL